MALTTAQLQALKADIDANFPGAPNNDDQNFSIAQFYNMLASPAYRVWRTNITTAEIKSVMIWTDYIGRTVAEKSTFELMIRDGIIDASKQNVRDGFAAIFSGGTGTQIRNALTALAKRDATRVEKLFATGTGADASPSTMSFEGLLSPQEVSAARNI